MSGHPKAQVLDTLFGTRYHTPGAALQLPRKVPMRVEPKSYFGTLLHSCVQPGFGNMVLCVDWKRGTSSTLMWALAVLSLYYGLGWTLLPVSHRCTVQRLTRHCISGVSVDVLQQTNAHSCRGAQWRRPWAACPVPWLASV